MHPVEGRGGVLQRLACDEVLGVGIASIVMPAERDIQIDALTAAVISGANDVGISGNLTPFCQSRSRLK